MEQLRRIPQRLLATSLVIIVIIIVVSCIPIVQAFEIVEAEAEAKEQDAGFVELVAWMKQHGGRVDPRWHVAPINGLRSAVALEQIPDGTELLYCPWELVLGHQVYRSHTDSDNDDNNNNQKQKQKSPTVHCPVVHQLAHEMSLGSDSLWWPYIHHIELPRLMSDWSDAVVRELQGLPPSHEATRHVQWYQQVCRGDLSSSSSAPHATRALIAFLSRASQVGMIPLYDLLNHHNGLKNAKLQLLDSGVQLVVVGGDVQAGQALVLSYGVKSAATMFRDYGFVEDWPSNWSFRDDDNGDQNNHVFVNMGDGVFWLAPTADFFQLVWQHSSPGSTRVLQYEFQNEAHRHALSLSFDYLQMFVHAGQRQLEQFATTREKDDAILISLHEEQEQQKYDNDMNDIDDSNLQDVRSAIEYRVAFKSALQGAIQYAHEILHSKQQQQQQEL